MKFKAGVRLFSGLGLVTRIASVGFAVILLVTLVGPALYGVDPSSIVGPPLIAPATDPTYVLGTDVIGRDVLAGLLSGGLVTLSVGAVAGLLSLTVGVTLGSAAGYFGGRLDSFLMRLTEFFQVLPILLFAMVIITLFKPSLFVIAAAIGSVAWPATARVTRAEFLRIKELDYIKAARTVGVSEIQIILRQVLPNALPPIMVIGTLVIGSAMLFESGLSYLGLSDPSSISWGSMIGANRERISEAWWTVTLPGTAIFLAVLCISLIGDGLNEILDPKRKR